MRAQRDRGRPPPPTAAGGPVGVIPAGERWPDGTLRVAVEDALGAGAIVAALGGLVALAGGRARRSRSSPPPQTACPPSSPASRQGRELIADGYGADVELAAAHDVSPAAPHLIDGLLTG